MSCVCVIALFYCARNLLNMFYLYTFIDFDSFRRGNCQDGKMMFTLEANNLVDENGNSKQTQMPYFENGWVEEKDEAQTNSDGGFKFPWQK
jgi:hypothetical protein